MFKIECCTAAVTALLLGCSGRCLSSSVPQTQVEKANMMVWLGVLFAFPIVCP